MCKAPVVQKFFKENHKEMQLSFKILRCPNLKKSNAIQIFNKQIKIIFIL